jgi:hypothetical protein
MKSSYSLGRVAGIEIGINWSVLALLALLMWTLATGVFPSTNPGLGDNAYFAMAVVSSLAFFASILLHELGHGGFTNFSDPVVRQYNIDIAMEAAGLGVDDILYDYVRRPDGPLDTMVFPGLKGGAQASIVSFLRNARSALDPTGAFLGASLFGIAADRPEEVAQNVPEIARNVDYVAPLIYPSHWGPGVYGVAEPEREPKKIIEESLIRFNKLTAGTGARVVPWLQDFSLAVHYGPKEVCAQIDGAKAENVHEYIMWDALVTYTKAACLTP